MADESGCPHPLESDSNILEGRGMRPGTGRGLASRNEADGSVELASKRDVSQGARSSQRGMRG